MNLGNDHEHSEKYNRVKIYKEELSRAKEYNNGNKNTLERINNSYYTRQSTDLMK